MKKFAKMSLVAAVVVAGFTSTVSAQNLAETASEVDVFGYVNIRYDDINVKNTGANANSNTYTHKTVLGASGNINDDLTYTGAVTEFQADTGAANYAASTLMVYNYFTYTGIANTAISAGRQGIASPLTVVYDPATGTSEGNGIVATSKVGPVSLTAVYFSGHDFSVAGVADNTLLPTNTAGTTKAITGSENYISIGAAAKVGPVSLDLWFAQMAEMYDTVTVGASGTFKAGDVAITPSLRYTTTDIDNVSADQSLIKGGLKLKAGIFGASIEYGETDKQGGWVAHDKDASAALSGWTQTLLGKADSEAFKGNINVDLTPKLNLSVVYFDLTRPTGVEEVEETFVTLNYKMSSNFSAYVRYGEIDYTGGTTSDIDRGRVNLLWLF